MVSVVVGDVFSCRTQHGLGTTMKKTKLHSVLYELSTGAMNEAGKMLLVVPPESFLRAYFGVEF
jgi:hypothetical protein